MNGPLHPCYQLREDGNEPGLADRLIFDPCTRSSVNKVT